MRHKNSKVIIAYSIVSPLHLINFLSYLDSNDNQYEEVHIFISNYWGKTTIPKRYIDYCISQGFKVLLDKKEQINILESLFLSDSSLTFAFVKSPSLKVLFKDIFSNKIESIVIVDEGISSYANYTHSLKAVLREKGILYVGKSLIYHSTSLPFKLRNKNKITAFSAFEKKNLSVNEEYKISFINTLNKLQLFDSKVEQDYNNSFLFCSQPWVDLGFMNKEEYAQLLQQLRLRANSIGKDLVIKKHPADSIFDYKNFNVVDFDGCVEELVWTCNFFGIISICSTSSILIPACLGYKSYILDFNDIEKLDSNLKYLFKTYCSEFTTH